MISYLGSLVQCSPATGRAGAADRFRSVWIAPPCSGHTGFAPLTGVCALTVYTAQAPGCSIWSGPCIACGSSFRVFHKSADSVEPVFCAFPGLSGSGSQGLGHTLPGCGAPFPSSAPARAASQVLQLVYVLRSWPLAATLQVAADVDHPESREVFR